MRKRSFVCERLEDRQLLSGSTTEAWTQVHSTQFSQFLNTPAVGAGDTLVDTLTESDPSQAFAVNGGNLIVSTNNTVGYSSIFLVEPATDQAQESRIVISQSNQSTNGQVAAVLRKNPSASTYYLAYLNGDGSTVIDASSAGGGDNLANSVWSVPYNPAHSYSLDFSATGVSPTTLQWIVTDISTGQVVNVGYVQDSSGGLQQAGEQGLTTWSNGLAVSFDVSSITTYARGPILASASSPDFLGFIGDSITLGTADSGRSGAQYEQTFLNVADPLSPMTINDQGVGGTTTSDWLPSGMYFDPAVAAFSAAISQMPTPPARSYVQIMLGTNDAKSYIGTSEATYLANMTQIVNTLVSDGFTVILNVPLYVVPGTFSGQWTDSANGYVASYGRAFEHLINNTTVLAGWFGGESFYSQNTQDLYDRVHPNGDQGYSILGYEWAISFLADLSASPLFAVQWTGLGDGASWNDGDNWSDALIPTPDDEVTIPASADVQLGSGTLAVAALALQGNATLDLQSGTLQIDFGSDADPIFTIFSYIQSGYNGGAWSGTGIISSDAAANDGIEAVGYDDGNTDVGMGPAQANQIVLMNTRNGDANLDGVTNFSDLLVVAQNFGKTGTDWAHGDFNYDARTNFPDLLIVAQNYGKSLPAGAASQLPLAATSTPTGAVDAETASDEMPASASAPSEIAEAATSSPAPAAAVLVEPAPASSQPVTDTVDPISSEGIAPATSSSSPPPPTGLPHRQRRVHPTLPAVTIYPTITPAPTAPLNVVKPAPHLFVSAAIPPDTTTDDALSGVWTALSPQSDLLRHARRRICL